MLLNLFFKHTNSTLESVIIYNGQGDVVNRSYTPVLNSKYCFCYD